MKRYPLNVMDMAPTPKQRTRGWIILGLVIAYAVMVGVLCSQTGCAAPLVSSNIDINANRNTVPLVGQ